VFDLLTDHNFLSSLAAMIGPLAFFAAPTEEIEHLLLQEDAVEIEAKAAAPAYATTDSDLAQAA
jgi:hypothetical protein